MNTAQPAIDPAVGMALMDRFPGTTRAGLSSMWLSALAWVESQTLPGAAAPVAVVEQAAILHVLSVLVNDRTKREGSRFSASEMLIVYRK